VSLGYKNQTQEGEEPLSFFAPPPERPQERTRPGEKEIFVEGHYITRNFLPTISSTEGLSSGSSGIALSWERETTKIFGSSASKCNLKLL